MQKNNNDELLANNFFKTKKLEFHFLPKNIKLFFQYLVLKKRVLTFCIFLFTLFFFISGCNKSKSPHNSPIYLKATNLYNSGDYKKSAELYKKYLKRNPDSAKSYYKLAVISQETDNYINAIYYYKKYLNLKPNSSDKNIIKKWIKSSQQALYKRFKKRFNGSVHLSAEQRKNYQKIMKINKKLKRENKKLKNFIKKYKDVLIPAMRDQKENQ